MLLAGAYPAEKKLSEYCWFTEAGGLLPLLHEREKEWLPREKQDFKIRTTISTRDV